MTLKLFACGDYLNFYGEDTWISDELASIVHSADISIANFEAPIKIDGMKPIKKAGPHLYQHEQSISCLKNAGFNFVSLANNHIYDYGYDALAATIKMLEENNIDYVGGGLNYKDAYSYRIVNKNGISIALLAACENEFGCLYEDLPRGGYAWLFNSKLEDKIIYLKSKVNYIVLIAHAGVENIAFPIKEWRQRYKRLCELGVDVIIGHHPHVPQGWEYHDRSLIFYSLGNFYFNRGSYALKNDDSYSVVIRFNPDGFDFNCITHKNNNSKLEISEEVGFNFDELNDYLCFGYDNNNKAICLKLFDEYYYDYYLSALGRMPTNASFKNKIKFLIKRLIYGNEQILYNNLLLLHNIRIDSHRFVVQRALSELYEKP